MLKLGDGYHCRCGALLATKRVWLKHVRICALAREDLRRQSDADALVAARQALDANRRGR